MTMPSGEFRYASFQEKRSHLHRFWDELKCSKEDLDINLNCVGDVARLFYERRVLSDVADNNNPDFMGATFVRRYVYCRDCPQFPGECSPYSKLKEVWKH